MEAAELRGRGGSSRGSKTGWIPAGNGGAFKVFSCAKHEV